jgi:hypothetical protein
MAQDRYLKIKKCGSLSVAKVFAVFGLVIGVIALIFAAGIGALRSGTGLAAGIGIGLVVLVLLVVGLFVCGGIESFLYNVIAGLVGPIKITLDKKGTIGKIDPLSYAKIAFIFSFIIYGIIAIVFSSMLFVILGATPGPGTGLALSLPLVAAAFVFILLVYGFVIPIVWAAIYNWLADRMGGVIIVLSKGVLRSVDIGSYVKMVVVLSVLIFIIEKVIGTSAGIALGIHQTGGIPALVAGLVVLVIASIVVNALVAFFYNLVAKKFGGFEIDISR